MYLVQASHLKEGGYYISCWGMEYGITTLKEVSEQDYQEYNRTGGDPFVTYLGIESLGDVLSKIQYLRKMVSVTEVEVGIASKIHPACLCSFKVLRHLPMEEIDRYLEEHREEILAIAKKNQDQATVQAFDDYDYLKTMQ